MKLYGFDYYWFWYSPDHICLSVELKPHPDFESMLRGIGRWESFFIEGGEWHLNPFGWGLLADWLEEHWSELEWVGEPNPEQLTYLLEVMRKPLLAQK